jgi:hypothetical protein
VSVVIFIVGFYLGGLLLDAINGAALFIAAMWPFVLVEAVWNMLRDQRAATCGWCKSDKHASADCPFKGRP